MMKTLEKLFKTYGLLGDISFCVYKTRKMMKREDS